MDEPPFALVCGWRYPLLIIAKGGSFSTVSTLRLFSSTSIACGFLYENKKAMKSFDFTAFSGAMEGTRTPGLLIRSQSLYPAELPTHTFRSEQDVFYHAGRGLSTVFCRFFDFIFVFYFFTQKSTSFRFFNIFRADLRLPLPDARRCGHRSALRQGRPGRSPADRGRADCPRGPWHR